MKLEFNFNIVPAYDVIARLAGSERPNEWIIRGNHHDAWVNGAEDPVSGQAPLIEEARALGMLLKQGWKPRRKWEVENRGVQPDIEIEFDPKLWRQGRDPRLETAVDCVLVELAKSPPQSK